MPAPSRVKRQPPGLAPAYVAYFNNDDEKQRGLGVVLEGVNENPRIWASKGASGGPFGSKFSLERVKRAKNQGRSAPEQVFATDPTQWQVKGAEKANKH